MGNWSSVAAARDFEGGIGNRARFVGGQNIEVGIDLARRRL